MWYVIVLIWLALVVGLVWAYRRKRERYAAARDKQLEALLSEAKLNLISGAANGAASQVAIAKVHSTPIPEFSKKQRLLPKAGALLYYVFRAGLPDHEIFANLTLADLIDIGPAIRGYEREQKLRRLAQQRLDLVICTKQLEVIAAVLIDKNGAPDAAQAANTRIIEECLKTAGIRLVCINPAMPPRHQHVRNLIYDIAD